VALLSERMALLGDPTRLRILDQLWDGERNVQSIADALLTTQQNVSGHLRLLRAGGLVTRRPVGREVLYAQRWRHQSRRWPPTRCCWPAPGACGSASSSDLELDCVHEVSGQGAWLKVPLGKLKSERMVPLDDRALAIVDRIADARSPGRPLPHPREGRMVDFLLTRQGRRVTDHALRGTLKRAAHAAGIDPVAPHQLRHTYATALINAGVSLQALMTLLGHTSAAMSLRYGRLFDATVRADYERALAQAKDRLGPVLLDAQDDPPDGDWRELALIKSRLAGGYCIRTAAQGVCSTATSASTAPTSDRLDAIITKTNAA